MIPLPLKQGLKRLDIDKYIIDFFGYDSTSTKTRIETAFKTTEPKDLE